MSKSLNFRKPLYHPDIPFIIFWSHKAACTTVSKWFFLQLGQLRDDMRHNVRVHSYERAYKSRPGYLDEVCRAAAEGRPVIKFARDPYARAYSGYLGVCGRDTRGIQEHWGTPIREQIIRDLTGGTPAPEYTFSFRQYLRWLCTQDMASLNGHVRAQYVARDDFFNIQVLRIESLSDHLVALEKKFRLPRSISDNTDLLDSGHHHTKSASFDLRASRAFLDLGIPLKRRPEFPYVKFNKAVADGTEFDELMQRCFSQDIELYGD